MGQWSDLGKFISALLASLRQAARRHCSTWRQWSTWSLNDRSVEDRYQFFLFFFAGGGGGGSSCLRNSNGSISRIFPAIHAKNYYRETSRLILPNLGSKAYLKPIPSPVMASKLYLADGMSLRLGKKTLEWSQFYRTFGGSNVGLRKVRDTSREVNKYGSINGVGGQNARVPPRSPGKWRGGRGHFDPELPAVTNCSFNFG